MNAEMQAGLYVKHPVVLSDFNRRWKMATNFNQTLSTRNIKKIHPAALGGYVQMDKCRKINGSTFCNFWV
jgi:hypothetical protein